MRFLLAFASFIFMSVSLPAKPLVEHGLADLTSGFHDVTCHQDHCVFTYELADVPTHPRIDVGLIEVEGHVHGAVCQNGQCTFIN